MPATPTSPHARHVVVALAASGFVLLTVANVRAQDGGNFFEQLFGMPRNQAPMPVQPSYDPTGRFTDGTGHRRPRSDARPVPKPRYAALPRPDADAEKILGKQPVDQKAIQANPTAALLKDPTLRAGDIVVMPGGPKVFTGTSAKRHRMSEFEDVSRTRMIDKATRRQLVAMMLPIGAMPADEARKVMAARRRLAPQEEIETDDGVREAAGPRLIAPWTTSTP